MANTQTNTQIISQESPINASDLRDMANAIRVLSIDAVEKANSGHPGMPMGCADMATVLFSKFLKFDPSTPLWPNRDRFILSAGHGSMLLYSLLHLTGYEKMTLDQIKNFRQLHSLTPGHPEVMQDMGIETTTGPLGQGIASAVGFALAERLLNQRFGDDLVDHKTYVIASDGDLMEGISHEACSLAGHLGLNKLIVMYDDNGITIDGKTDIAFTDDTTKRFESYGWDVMSVDGHDHNALETALTNAQSAAKPVLIRCKTTIGLGAPTKSGQSSSHGSPLGEQELSGAKKFYGWASNEPFDIPAEILNNWRAIGAAGAKNRQAWDAVLSASPADTQTAFNKTIALDYIDDLTAEITAIKQSFAQEKPKLATRASSGKVLEKLLPAIPELVGGSADLSGSNNTNAKGISSIQKNQFDGQYIHYGVREHGMAAIMNGMALHGGVVPYGGTFLIFSDYCKHSIRLAALMKQPSIFVLTHDSIGLGEDGPTHQPIEQLAGLRSIPNLQVIRPCDCIETAEAWDLALRKKNGPTAIILSRQGLPCVRGDLPNDISENLSARGAYVLKDATSAPAKVKILATGSEVEIALKAQDMLAADNIATQVISVPCFETFMAQDESYRTTIINHQDGCIYVGVEAACRMGWDQFIGSNGIFIGMNGFGDSAPADQLYDYFGITAPAIVAAVKAKL